jgi:hypothetical protein
LFAVGFFKGWWFYGGIVDRFDELGDTYYFGRDGQSSISK